MDADIRDVAMKIMVDFVDIVRDEYDAARGRIRSERWSDRYHYPAYALALLYKTPHPLNPYRGDRDILEMSVRLADDMARRQDETGRFEADGPRLFGWNEWGPYYITATREVLGRDLPAEYARRWRSAVARYIAGVATKPFFFTSPNHEAWRCAVLVRAGRVFKKKEWVDQGLFMLRQHLKLREQEGFWEESMHHGVSTGYNYTELRALAPIYRLTGKRSVREAMRRLVGFMARFAIPDGSTAGCLDGRQPYGLGRLHLGLSMFPQGSRLNELSIESQRRYDALWPSGRCFASSTWAGHATPANMADLFRWGRPARSQPLPQEGESYVATGAGTHFGGGVARRGRWFTAVSAIISDVTRISEDIYRLERQNRIDIWHEKCGLMVGGGSNQQGSPLPYANALLDTGYEGSVDFGMVRPSLAHRESSDVQGGQAALGRSYYYPRSAACDVSRRRAKLTLVFAHGDVTFTVRPVNRSSLEVEFAYETSGVRDLYVQLPVVEFHTSTLRADGRRALRDRMPVRQSLAVTNAAYGSTFEITPPAGHETRLRPALSSLRSYRGLDKAERYDWLYRVNILSCRIRKPAKGGGKFTIRVK